MTGRRRLAAKMLEPKAAPEPQSAPQTGDGPATGANLSEGIPSHVWALLSEAGELAAERLRDLLASPRFKTFRASEQRALIDLALTRAYGLPVRRSLSVSLASADTDAIAASLIHLQDALPERAEAAPQPRDVTPSDPETGDT